MLGAENIVEGRMQQTGWTALLSLSALMGMQCRLRKPGRSFLDGVTETARSNIKLAGCSTGVWHPPNFNPRRPNLHRPSNSIKRIRRT